MRHDVRCKHNGDMMEVKVRPTVRAMILFDYEGKLLIFKSQNLCKCSCLFTVEA